jgi:hypothetical protein
MHIYLLSLWDEEMVSHRSRVKETIGCYSSLSGALRSAQEYVKEENEKREDEEEDFRWEWWGSATERAILNDCVAELNGYRLKQLWITKVPLEE